MSKGSKRERAVALINNGEWTREKLMKELKVTKRGLDSLFCYLRMSYRYPYSDPETGILEILTEEKLNARKEIDRQRKALDKFQESRKYVKRTKEVESLKRQRKTLESMQRVLEDKTYTNLLLKKNDVELEIAVYDLETLVEGFYEENNINDQLELTL